MPTMGGGEVKKMEKKIRIIKFFKNKNIPI
jgi:hypothetical protein